jgi:hypothetical protein
MAFTSDHLMHVAPMRLRERKLFMSTPDDHPIRIVPNPKRLRASLGGRVVADTMRALTHWDPGGAPPRPPTSHARVPLSPIRPANGAVDWLPRRVRCTERQRP